jgi:dephospho-CoA kinase
MSFKSFLIEQEQLDEKLLVVGQGKKYNQIVFLAGGSGSGKDFVIHNFMEGEKFKVIDPDQLIELFLKVQKIKGGDFLNFSLKNPDDVTAIYDYVKNEKGWKYKKLENLK